MSFAWRVCRRLLDQQQLHRRISIKSNSTLRHLLQRIVVDRNRSRHERRLDRGLLAVDEESRLLPILRCLLCDPSWLSRELLPASNSRSFRRTCCGVFRRRQGLTRPTRQVALSCSAFPDHRVLATLGSPFLASPLGQAIGWALGALVAAASLLVASNSKLGFAGTPLAGTTTLR